MKNANYGWHQRFRELYDKALVKYGNEHRKVEAFFTPREVGVLRLFGAKPMELYDYAEDSSDLDSETALLITAVAGTTFSSSKRPPGRRRRLRWTISRRRTRSSVALSGFPG